MTCIICEVVDRNVPNVLSLAESLRLNLVRRINNKKSMNVNQNESEMQNVKQNEILKKNVKQKVIVHNEGSKKIITNAHCKYDSAVKFINDFSDVFSGVGKNPGEYSLKINPDIPTVASPPRPIPAPLREPVHQKAGIA